MGQEQYDVVVIGAGPGGYPCAIRLGQLKKKVCVVEKRELGGLCLNWGCIPTKALSYAAEMLDQFDKARRMGIAVEAKGVDLTALRAYKDGVVKRLRAGIDVLFRGNGVVLKRGEARVLDEHRVEIGAGGGVEVIEAEHVVLATGTDVAALAGLDYDGKRIINTDHALELADIPASLLVVGAGASGLEMATIYHRLGSRVTVVEMMEQILPGMDRECCASLTKILRKSGITISLASQVSRVSVGTEGIEAVIRGREGETSARFDRVLVTVGRKPCEASFRGLGLARDKRGYLVVDEAMRCSVKNVFAIGDIAGTPLLAHKATKQGTAVAEIIAGERTRCETGAIPGCVFTIPPLSSVGMTEEEARSRLGEIRVGRFPYRAAGKALAMCESEGFVKVLADRSGRIVGVHILGAESPSLIGEGILAVAGKLTIEDMSAAIHPHPTLSEMMREAAEHALHRAIHVLN